MTVRPTVATLRGCPDRETLAAFSSGRMSEPELERLAGHVGSCARCEKSLQEIMNQLTDSFEAGLLRAFAAVSLNAAGGELDSEAVAAKALGRTDAWSHSIPGAAVDGQSQGLARTSLGPYALSEMIGRGGMGVVYRAVHQVLQWTVALKTLYPGGEVRTDTVARFRREAEVIARLKHPNIVRIYDFNESEGVSYLAMELVEGETLARKLSRGPLALREAVELVQSIADAVGHAHGQKVLHRDLKPGNVLIARDGTPKVSDFGLAKILEEGNSNLTETDAVMGTPSYMAPEQAAGRTAEVGPQTDVYALGAILYESLTGVPPFVGDGRLATLSLVQVGDVFPPSKHRPEVPADLDAVCLKALAPSLRDRYPSAEALVQELGRWLNGERTLARRPGPLRRCLRRVGRRRVLTGILLAGLAGGFVAAFPPPWHGPTAGDTSAAAPTEIRTPDGRLLPFRVRAGADQTKVTADADGTITVNTWGMCLIEYVPGPGVAPYRLRASVRHLQSDPSGQVGVYFAHRAFPGTFGEAHLFGRMTYNDLWSPADQAALPAQPPPVAARRSAENNVHLGTLVHVAGRERPWIGTTILAAGAPFRVCGVRADCWRRVEVVVAPTGVTGFWEGLPVGSVAVERITSALVSHLNMARERKPEADPPPDDAGKYDPNGSVGLYVDQSSAAFRLVEVTPVEKAH